MKILSAVVACVGLASQAAAWSHRHGVCVPSSHAPASWPGIILILSAVVVALAAVRARTEGACVGADPALQWLEARLSSGAAISCRGQPLQQLNANRYWGEQFSKNASVVVFPATARDVSHAVQAARWSRAGGGDMAIVGGAHSQINASSSYGFVLDMSWMNSSRLIRHFTNPDAEAEEPFAAVEYQGGATWGQVQAVTNGSGYAAVGARVANVGAGGFTLGGGIGFLAGAYGFAADRLVQAEVVLPSTGEVVLATKRNEYADLFWALQGGSGQFGVVTRFWQRAVPEPRRSTLGFYYVRDEDVARLRRQTVDFFRTNDDPFNVVYYSFGYLPQDLSDPTARGGYARRTLLITLHFEDEGNPHQRDAEAAFRDLLDGIDTSQSTVLSTGHYANLALVGEAAYPYGHRRGFYGAQTSTIDEAYLANLTDTFWSYIDTLIARGEQPHSASMVMQYMFPGLNGHLPSSDSDTAWPHASVGHQTLITPAYQHAENDALTLSTVRALNDITYAQQQHRSIGVVGGGFLANYPNYMAPGDGGCRVWGHNVDRLIQVKEKYDPECLIRNGRVFASPGCLGGGWANVFSDCGELDVQ
ncbi:FAD binding domain protein [Cordyceps fumosorosea ARSEF 2679]|uniref:FAD binding domain protein n=1 Tax=Cordyceps fumosorosea (strain ARSEF 2679) TaxID=1081104 RepID=A0A168B3D6_CORFA|nr:FAD binding domain protein [Cordyceps fumosorosea ARSEF 2679]OAA69566.1 FAD binding domain protein [Cordyceps fumosorosea ARSEF 2679]